MSDGWVDAKVQVQGDSLVVQDAASGDCALFDVTAISNHGHISYGDAVRRLQSIFGREVAPEWVAAEAEADE